MANDLPLQTVSLEHAMVGAVILEPAELPRVSALVQPEDLADSTARTVYESVRFLAVSGQPPDPILLAGDLRARGKLEGVGGMAGLAALSDAAPTGTNAEYYAVKVAEAARDRRMRAAVENAYLALQAGSEPAAVTAELKSDLDAAALSGNRKLEARTAEELLASYLESETPLPTISTGYEQWDVLHGGGLAAGDFTVIGAAPSVGKSQFALNLVTRMRLNAQAARVLLISLEMPDKDVLARLIALQGHMNVTTARVMLRRQAKEYTWQTFGWNFDTGIKAVEKLPVRIVYGSFRPADLSALAARYAGRFDVMVVDYLQRVAGEKGQKTLERVTEASRVCKDIALTHDVHVLGISSLNRDGYRNGDRPNLASLRETGDLEFDADNVWLLWREKAKGVKEEELEIHIEKQRNGPLDWLPFTFELESGLISEKRKHDDHSM